MALRRLLLAGSVGPERIPARTDPDDADWYLPLHVRDRATARERIADQVSAGADVVVAPTWLTHRRALLPLAETRRAAVWTADAVNVAREGLEAGLERRTEGPRQDEGEVQGQVQGHEPPLARPVPQVAACLPVLGHDPDPGTGRILPREAATQRDYRDQAGILAEAEPDLLLVEGRGPADGIRLAIVEAVEAGLPVWASLGAETLARSSLEGWLEWSRVNGVERLLLAPPVARRIAATEGDIAWGGLTREPGEVAGWLDAGAGAIAMLDGASGPALEPVRRAIDDWERAGLEAARTAEQRWQAFVANAAAMAPGGVAAWLGPPPDAALPAGFDWLVLEATESRRLPAAHYRLVIAPGSAATDLGVLLESGGILVVRGTAVADGGLRPVLVDDAGAARMVAYRRVD